MVIKYLRSYVYKLGTEQEILEPFEYILVQMSIL